MATNYVLLWFDTEDYLTPESDDAALALARMLTDLGVRATFKVVGEKARVLERRGRRDVLAALKRHDIGYHTDFHSVHPTVSEYLEGMDWEAGVAEFARRERAGLEDVQRLFETEVSCYGQPGGAWAPHVFPVLRQWNIPLYLDEGGHVGLNDRPFWYGHTLNIFRLRSNCTRVSLRGEGDALPAAGARFQEISRRLAEEGGGLISIYYHPCEFATAQFWDGVNFARGANPPREQWQPAPLLSPAEAQRRLAVFREYVAFIRSQPEVEFVTGREAVALFPDPVRTHSWTVEQVMELAQKIKRAVDFQSVGGCVVSPAEAFSLLVAAVVDDRTGSLRAQPLWGPAGSPGCQTRPGSCSVEELKTACRRVRDAWASTGCLPDQVAVGSGQVGPATFLRACAETLVAQATGRKVEAVVFQEVEVATAQHVAADDPSLWSWVIFPEGFQAPRLMAQARRLAWTLKPAQRNS